MLMLLLAIYLLAMGIWVIGSLTKVFGLGFLAIVLIIVFLKSSKKN